MFNTLAHLALAQAKRMASPGQTPASWQTLAGKDGHGQPHLRADPADLRRGEDRGPRPRRDIRGRAVRAPTRDGRRAPGQPPVHLRALLLAQRIRECRLRPADAEAEV